uniref:Alkaline phosphatase n=1 Tax=Chilo suppressalis TaxID=168631 RepID=A0A2H5CLH1_CHISP|nr:alp5 [Chilo suppressalis]
MKSNFNLSRTTFYVNVLLFCASARNVGETKRSLPVTSFDEKNKDHWHIQAQWTLKNKVSAPLKTGLAKNVILFIGDGMSITTLAATRSYLGQRYGRQGEELKLSFEAFPYTGLSKPYCVDQNVADSACSATAYLSGVKANYGTVGLSAAVKKGDCEGQKQGTHSVTGLTDWAQKAGKKTGVVTTTRVTHATPSAAYAHSADRKWESDTNLPKHGPRCEDIASQLVRGTVGSKINVIFGGGRRNFLPRTEKDSEGFRGHRSDGNNLIKEWLNKKASYGVPAKYIQNRLELLTLKNSDSDVLGLFSPDHMPYHLEAGEDDPTLSEMTEKAIEILSRNKNGFFLLVEGGRIDTAHHEAKARKALDETAELAKAVEAALLAVDPEETLIVVTSDHSHTMTYSGYSKRGTDILGFTNKANATDSLPYTILSYANGPGYRPDRQNILLDDINNLNYSYPSSVPMVRETHGGEDVAVFAKGPWAHIFSGNYEQNYIPHAIAYASCIGPGFTYCKV